MAGETEHSVQVIATVITGIGVLAALFRETLQRLFYPPKLLMRIASKAGEAAVTGLASPAPDLISGYREVASRYYHVRVSNPRRSYTIRSVEVALLHVEKARPDGTFQTIWEGDVPLQWRHMDPHAPRAIGTPYDADLCSVVRGKWLELHPTVTPLSLVTRYRESVRLRVTVQARGEECDSPSLQVEIAWDGQWPDDTEEMRKHLVVRELNWHTGDLTSRA